MKIPRCPRCGDCKILLAPLENPDWLHGDKADKLPVACAECAWRGTWEQVVYAS